MFWKSWAHDWLFSEQDKWILEKVAPGPELLSHTDVSVIAWRRFGQQHARQPPRAEAVAARVASVSGGG